MIYGVPQHGRDKHTKRVKRIWLESENAAEELFLTQLDEALGDETFYGMTMSFTDGSEFCIEWKPDDPE